MAKSQQNNHGNRIPEIIPVVLPATTGIERSLFAEAVPEHDQEECDGKFAKIVYPIIG